jgi:hypothetical protein
MQMQSLIFLRFFESKNFGNKIFELLNKKTNY